MFAISLHTTEIPHILVLCTQFTISYFLRPGLRASVVLYCGSNRCLFLLFGFIESAKNNESLTAMHTQSWSVVVAGRVRRRFTLVLMTISSSNGTFCPAKAPRLVPVLARKEVMCDVPFRARLHVVEIAYCLGK